MKWVPVISICFKNKVLSTVEFYLASLHCCFRFKNLIKKGTQLFTQLTCANICFHADMHVLRVGVAPLFLSFFITFLHIR